MLSWRWEVTNRSHRKRRMKVYAPRHRRIVAEQLEDRALLATLVNTGTAADVVFALPSVANTVIFEDDGIAGNGLSRIRSTNSTFDTTTFANPTGSLTINSGNSADTITINSSPDFTAGLTFGASAKPFGGVTFAGALSLASGNSLAAFSSVTINLPNSSSDLATIGSGSVSLAASRAIVVATNASITTVNGGIMLSANQQLPKTTGNFTSISISGTLTTSGTGNISLTGTAGDSTTTASHRGVDISGGVVRSTSTVLGAGKISISGTGGAGTDHNSGVVISNSGDVESVVGDIQITGISGAGSTTFNRGVALLSGGQVKSTGTGNSAANIVIVGTGGSGTDSNFGVEVFGSGTAVSTQDGDIDITGTGSAAATGSFNYGAAVFGSGQVTSKGTGGSAGKITILGTAGGGSTGASNNNGIRIEDDATSVASVDGDIAITGRASTSSANKFSGLTLVSSSIIEITGAGRLSMTGTGGVSGNQLGNGLNLSSAISVANSSVTLIGDTMFLDPAGLTLNAAKVILLPKTPGRAIDLGQAASGATSFDDSSPIPASPVTVSFRAIRSGSAANGGLIHFTAQHLGPGLKPLVTINNTVPADLVVTLNLDGRAASLTATFASPQNSADLTFDAGPNRQGTLGNDISIAFTKANRQGQGPLVTFGGSHNDQIAVVLDTAGTTAAQLTDAINNSPLNAGIVTVSLFGSPNVNVSNTLVTGFQLTGGTDPSTAQDVIDAVNSAVVTEGQANAGQVVQATLTSGNGSTVVALDGPTKVYSDVVLSIPTGISALALSDDKLDTITAATLQIGDANSGPTVITADITRETATAINLISGGTISVIGGSIDSGGGDLTLVAGPSSAIYVQKAGNDATLGATGTTSFGPGSKLFIGIGGGTADSQYDQLNVVGNVDLTGVNLVVGLAFQPLPGNKFTIINNVGAGTTTGQFQSVNYQAQGNALIVDFQLDYHGGDGNDVVLTALNTAPTLDQISNPNPIDEDASLQTIGLTGLSAGDAGSNVVQVTAVSSNPSLIPDLVVDYSSGNPIGSLTYEPLPDQYGTAVITVTVQDDGGTASGGVDTVTRTFTVTVKSVNDPPKFDNCVFPPPALPEAVQPEICVVAGQDEDPATHGPAAESAIPSFAYNIVLGPPNESGTPKFTVTNDNNSLFAVQPDVSPSGKLTYTPKPNAQGTALVTVILDDGGGDLHASPPLTFPVQITKLHLFHNSADVGDRTGRDVTGSTSTAPDGFIVAADALAVINYINARGAGLIQPTAIAPPYVDVDADDQVVANDALSIINWINAHAGQSEGESATAGVDNATALDPWATDPASTASVPNRDPIADLISLLAADTSTAAFKRRRTLR